MHYAELRGTNLRLFEATACGGFVLTHTIEGLDSYFAVGSEVVAFDGPDELREALDHYLGADDERTAIATAGQERSHRDHTYEVRLQQLFETCGLGHLLPK